LKEVPAHTQCMIIARLAGIHQQRAQTTLSLPTLLFEDMQPTKQNREHMNVNVNG
jgi:hypothetical protein